MVKKASGTSGSEDVNTPCDTLAGVNFNEIGQDLQEMLKGTTPTLNPTALLNQSLALGKEWLKIWGGQSERSVNTKDWRFADPTWQENILYQRWAQSYEAFVESVNAAVEADADGKDWQQQEQLRFMAQMITSAVAPTNTLWGNPTALKRAYDTKGASLVQGAQHFMEDLAKNGGMPSQVDDSAFDVGKNLACTPGAVVFRNEVMELIQYQPTTAKVHKRPTLMICPPIGKYYFMDLAPGRSFVERAVSQGIQFFTISWHSPSEEQGGWDFDTYVGACLEAIDVITEITGSDKVNTLGLCAGGIITTLMLNYLASKGDDRIGAAAFGVMLLDFGVPAPIGAFHSKPLLALARKNSKKKGVYSGKDLGKVFAWLRPNDLVWNYWSNNYLGGQKPPSFDILAWNAHTANLPSRLHCQFLDIFEHNPLVKPGEMTVMGTPVDLSTIKVDTFVTGAVNDHLTPWKGCYETTQLFSGDSTFILSNAGHIASLVNPGNAKSSYFAGPTPGPDAGAWLQSAEKQSGTWWNVWADWSKTRSDEMVTAPKALGSKAHPKIVAAPGTYVLERD